MADINDHIARALASEATAASGKQRRVRRRRGGFSALLWVLAIVFFSYEFEQWAVSFGHHTPNMTVQDVEQLYDQAQAVLVQRYRDGQPLLAPFEEPALATSVGIVPREDGRYLLYYHGPGDNVPARELDFSRG